MSNLCYLVVNLRQFRLNISVTIYPRSDRDGGRRKCRCYQETSTNAGEWAIGSLVVTTVTIDHPTSR